MNLCLKCPDSIRGKCCISKDKLGPFPVILKCNFLTKAGWCSVYEERFEKQPNCITAEQMIKEGLCPEGCVYGAKTS